MDPLSIEPIFVNRFSNSSLRRDDVGRVEQTIASRIHGTNHRVGLTASKYPLHYQGIGDDEPGELKLVTQEIGEDLARQRCRGATGIEPTKRNVCGHDRRYSAFDRAAKWNQVRLLDDVRGFFHTRQLLVRIGGGAPVPGKMFRACEHAFRLTRIDPGSRILTDLLRIAAEGTRSDDRVVRLDIEVAVWRVDPVDAQLSRFSSADSGRPPDRLDVCQ